jgi:hypothetical protein
VSYNPDNIRVQRSEAVEYFFCAFVRDKLGLLKEMKLIEALIILPTFYNKIKITFTKTFIDE